VLSYHATKIFHTFEGGAVISKDQNIKKLIDQTRNFGFSPEGISIPGTNAKMNEFQAIIGLLMLELFEEEIIKRRKLTNIYRNQLLYIPGIYARGDIEGVTHNYINFTIRVIKDQFGVSRNVLHELLKDYGIDTRKYFSPLLSEMECYKGSSSNLPVASRVASEVLSLPLYGNLNEETIGYICDTIKELGIRFRR